MALQAGDPSTGSVVKLEFELADSSVPLVATTECASCRFRLEEIVPRGEGCYATYYSFEGCDPDNLLKLVAVDDTCEAHFLDHGRSTGLVELVVTDTPPVMFLAERGALPRRLVVEDGTMTITVEVLSEYDTNDLISQFTEAYPDADLIIRQPQSYVTPLFTPRELERTLAEHLTDRQGEALRAAYEGGYYEWPREATGEQLGEHLGIAPPTFHQHLRKAERKLVQLVFEERNLVAREPTTSSPGAKPEPSTDDRLVRSSDSRH